MTLRDYSGGAPRTKLTSDVSDVATDLTVENGAGYPDGVPGPFFIAVDAGTVNEEKILCSGRTGNVLHCVGGRGADGTVARAHTTNAVVVHVWTATDAQEANAHVNAVSDVHGVAGNLESAITAAADTVVTAHNVDAAAHAAAFAAHTAAANPHPVYATDADLTAHVGASNPHPLYATDADLTAHVGASDPHPNMSIGAPDERSPVGAQSAAPARWLDGVRRYATIAQRNADGKQKGRICFVDETQMFYTTFQFSQGALAGEVLTSGEWRAAPGLAPMWLQATLTASGSTGWRRPNSVALVERTYPAGPTLSGTGIVLPVGGLWRISSRAFWPGATTGEKRIALTETTSSSDTPLDWFDVAVAPRALSGYRDLLTPGGTVYPWMYQATADAGSSWEISVLYLGWPGDQP